MKKWLRILLITIISLILLLAVAFFIYASDYYRADDAALVVMQSGNAMQVQDNIIILSPATSSDTALILYPGA
jgi:capsular polysaccharide biosynthesis protein